MIKKRNLAVQILLTIVTLGIYAIYWYYVSYSEMNEYRNLGENPVIWTILLFIPILNLMSFYKHAEAVEALTERNLNKWLVFIVWWAFAPAAWLITQLELNKRATA